MPKLWRSSRRAWRATVGSVRLHGCVVFAEAVATNVETTIRPKCAGSGRYDRKVTRERIAVVSRLPGGLR